MTNLGYVTKKPLNLRNDLKNASEVNVFFVELSGSPTFRLQNIA